MTIVCYAICGIAMSILLAGTWHGLGLALFPTDDPRTDVGTGMESGTYRRRSTDRVGGRMLGGKR